MRLPLPVFAVLLSITVAVHADPTPTTRPGDLPFPPVYTAKVASTPRFYQRDPRMDLSVAGDNFCVPTSASDSFVYFATHGFDRLVPIDSGDLEIVQGELVKTLASPGYMSTNADTGTTPSNALTGIFRYVQEHGYLCRRLEYAGWRPLQRRWSSAAVAPVLNLNWIKAVVAAPNGTAWLEIGYYIHGDSPGQWRRVRGHCVVVVGYGTDGTRTDGRIFLVDNPAVGAMVPATPEQQANGMKWRPVTLPDQAITLTPTGSLQLFGEKSITPRNVSQLFQVDGPGVPYSRKKYAAAFIDGAVILVIGHPS
ncbi:MAG: hypothetical protein ABSB42_01290 [Tepidisphaeraceae bacterium]|jgi:hypothetical protein